MKAFLMIFLIKIPSSSYVDIYRDEGLWLNVNGIDYDASLKKPENSFCVHKKEEEKCTFLMGSYEINRFIFARAIHVTCGCGHGSKAKFYF